MKTKFLGSMLLLTSTMMMGPVQATPVLQVGAYAGSGDVGTYADYQQSTTFPTEEDTAITGGNTILFAGITSDLLQLGGQYILGGKDWDQVDLALSVFHDHGAIALLAVEDGKLASAIDGGITLGGASAIYSSETLSGLFPNNHDPLKDELADFLFFDIGNFAASILDPNYGLIPNFDSENQNPFDYGEIKALALGGDNLSLFNWIHFDLMALATDIQGTATIRTTWESSPNSKDVTWKNPNPPCDNPDGCDPQEVPEPNSMALIGLGMLGVAMTYLRMRAS